MSVPRISSTILPSVSPTLSAARCLPFPLGNLMVVKSQLDVPPLLDLPLGHNSQLVSSLRTKVRDDTIVPVGHGEQEVASENAMNGDDMYLLTGQHPFLAVLDPRLLKTFVELSHVLPHNVRVNPLFLNTAKITNEENLEEKKKNVCCQKCKTNSCKDAKQQGRKLRKILAM